MTDVFEQDKARFAGLTRSSEIVERVQLDLAQRAAQALESEKRAEAQARQDALSREAGIIAAADARTVASLAALKALYAQREAAARVAIESISALWRIEQDIRAGLNDADRAAGEVEALIEPTQRGPRRSALRERAGLPSRHIYAPDVKPTTEAQAIGLTTVRGITAGIIQPGTIAVGRDIVNI